MRFIEKRDENFPVIRIQKAVLNNFKGVEHGEIVFNCGRQFVPYGTKSDILGIYGQNGSGKTSFIEALNILRGLMLGAKIPGMYAGCIARGKEYSKLEFTFELQYKNEDVRKVVYEFCLAVIEKEKYNEAEHYEKRGEETENQRYPYDICVFDEKFSVSGSIDGEKVKMQQVINTACSGVPFGPASKHKYFIGSNSGQLTELELNKRLATRQARSFIFMKETLDIFERYGENSVYCQMLRELNYFSEHLFHVVDTRSSGFIRLNYAFPLYSRYGGQVILSADKPSTVSAEVYRGLCDEFKNMNIVLTQLVPGLSIGVKSLAPVLLKGGKQGRIIELIADRDGMELPLRDESDGIRKIVSVLSLIISAYNDESCTVAIDEFDAGVFEYLLGEILETFEESGKGQLIFTSHNLRPLEVINKNFLCFTTANPINRYIRLKNIGNSNNLRSTYFRELVMGEQDEELCNRTKKFKIVAAFRKAGMGDGQTT